MSYLKKCGFTLTIWKVKEGETIATFLVWQGSYPSSTSKHVLPDSL